MERFFTQFIQIIGKGCSFVIPNAFTNLPHKILTHFYTGFYSRRFAHWGASTIMYHAHRLNGLKYISVGDGTVLEKGIQLTAWDRFLGEHYHPQITIGNNCHIRANSHVTAINCIRIGDNLLTGTNVLITDNTHGLTSLEQLNIVTTLRPLHSKGPVNIGNNVWLGNNVCIMPGVSIGDNSVVGANAVVTHDIPPYSIAVGIPAKVIKQLSN